MPESVCLISSNDLSREGLNAILLREGFEVIYSDSDLSSFRAGNISTPLIFIIDLDTKRDLLAAVQSITSNYASAYVAVLADEFDFECTLNCYKAGARGYIVKSTSSKPLITAMQLIALGERYFPSEVLEVLQGEGFSRSREASVEEVLADAKLSPRELDVLCCLMAGYPNKVIARQLDVCEATIKVHVKAILRKLNVNNRTQAAIWANSHNLPEVGGATVK